MQTRAAIVDRLAPFVQMIELQPEGCPAWLSVGLPSERALERWTGLPAAALPAGGRLANGRGLSREACMRSCLGEFAELASCCDWGDAAIIHAPAGELGAEAISAVELSGLSPAQVDARERWNAEWNGFDWRPRAVPVEAAIDWIEVRDLFTGARAYAPADFVLIGRREAGDEAAVAIGDSNGCAAGPDSAGALLAAVLELVERDAVARWWYGRRARPLVELASVEGDAELFAFLRERARRTRVYDITSDLAVPAFAAVSAEPDGRDIAIGHAAGPDPHRAVESALTELLQMEVALEQARRLGAGAGNWHRWRREVDMTRPPLSLAGAALPLPAGGPAPATGAALTRCLDACRAGGIRLYAIELTRAEIGVPVVRALSPDLCHIKPRYARRRLRDGGDGASLAEVFPLCV